MPSQPVVGPTLRARYYGGGEGGKEAGKPPDPKSTHGLIIMQVQQNAQSRHKQAS